MVPRVSVWMTAALAFVLITNTGCYLDQFRDAQEANRNLTVEKDRVAQDLADAESQNELLKARVDSLNGELAGTKQHVTSLMAENEDLRARFRDASDTIKAMAAKEVPGPVIIDRGPLPPALDKSLQEFASKYPDVLSYDSAKGAVRWKADLLFALGSDVLRETVATPLREFAEILKSPDAEGFEATIVGHTCNTPIVKGKTRAEHKTNWHLSAHRSISVMFALKNYGVPPTRMGVMGYGEYRPIAPNTTAESKAKNRRVEIFLVPQEKIQAVASAANRPTEAAGK